MVARLTHQSTRAYKSRNAWAGVDGFRQLDAKFAKLEAIDRRTAAAALNAGAAILVAEEKRLAPALTGNLRDSILSDMWPTNFRGDGLTIWIGPRTGPGGPDGWYGVFAEFGTINTSAHPFVRPAVDGRGQQALGLVSSMIERDIIRAAA